VLRSTAAHERQKEADSSIGTKGKHWRCGVASALRFLRVHHGQPISVVIGGIVTMKSHAGSVTIRRREIRRSAAPQSAQRNATSCASSCSRKRKTMYRRGSRGNKWGVLVAFVLANHTPFPASVQTWVVRCWGDFSASGVGLVFGIYRQYRASRMDPVVALRRNDALMTLAHKPRKFYRGHGDACAPPNRSARRARHRIGVSPVLHGSEH